MLTGVISRLSLAFNHQKAGTEGVLINLNFSQGGGWFYFTVQNSTSLNTHGEPWVVSKTMSLWEKETVKDHRRWGECDRQLPLTAPIEACTLHIEQWSHYMWIYCPLPLTDLEGLAQRKTWFMCRISHLCVWGHRKGWAHSAMAGTVC